MLRAQPPESPAVKAPGGVVFDGPKLWVVSTYLRAFDAISGDPLTAPNDLDDAFDNYPHTGWGPDGPSATYAHDVDWRVQRCALIAKLVRDGHAGVRAAS